MGRVWVNTAETSAGMRAQPQASCRARCPCRLLVGPGQSCPQSCSSCCWQFSKTRDMSGSTGWTNIGAALHGAQTPDRPDSSRVLRDLLAALVCWHGGMPSGRSLECCLLFDGTSMTAPQAALQLMGLPWRAQRRGGGRGGGNNLPISNKACSS